MYDREYQYKYCNLYSSSELLKSLQLFEKNNFLLFPSLPSDASYIDPLGPQIERPKTASRKKIDDDEFADEELGDDLLPEWSSKVEWLLSFESGEGEFFMGFNKFLWKFLYLF